MNTADVSTGLYYYEVIWNGKELLRERYECFIKEDSPYLPAPDEMKIMPTIFGVSCNVLTRRKDIETIYSELEAVLRKEHNI